jgi:sarcosine oxidase
VRCGSGVKPRVSTVYDQTCTPGFGCPDKPQSSQRTSPLTKRYDVTVVGAGVFGAWIAYHLRRSGKTVLLLDAYGAANARASSGGESRIIRMGYGADEIYTRWAIRSLTLWQEFFRTTREPLFHRAGVLWMAREADPYSLNTLGTLEKFGVRFEKLSRTDLEKSYPQIEFGSISWGILEPDSGAIMARRAVQRVVEAAVDAGVDYRIEKMGAARKPGVDAGTLIYACGAWLPKLFPELLQDRIHSTRQEVFFFGVPAGDRRFAPPAMPISIDFGGGVYGVPDLENRGFKIGPDHHGPSFDPDSGDRVVTAEGIAAARRFLAQRFPALKDAPLVETRVCQYENTSNGDFLIDRHPEIENVWLVGGGSGHGFKHGPALGEYVAAKVLEGGAPEPRFTLATKANVRKREVF